MSPVGPLRVLVTDGYPDAADTLVMILALRGFEARAAYDRAAAESVLASWNPDGVLIDLDLPDGSGFRVGREARQRFANITIVGMTGWDKTRYQAMATAAGFDYVLLKPIDHRSVINMLLDRAELAI